MNPVPVHQALFWPGDSPVSPGGAADFPALAKGLANADYRGVSHGPLRARERTGPLEVSGLREKPALRRQSALRRQFALRQQYSCAQHAVVASRAVETLAVLNLRERRVLAMHAWLAEVREAELTGHESGEPSGARKRLALRFMELEALADVLACTMHWDGRSGQGASPAKGAQDVDRILVGLSRMAVPERNRLALHALLSELIPAGLGPWAADAALGAAGLAREAPGMWVDILRFVRRMADETVRRDLPRGAAVERTGFPALAVRIQAMAPEAASRLWLERYRTLRAAVSAKNERRKAEER